MKKTAVCDIISPYKSARRRYTEDFKVKAFEIAEDIIGKDFINTHPGTVDRLKFGDETKEVRKIAVCLAATPDVLRQCRLWGADLIITHEPIYYDHEDVFRPGRITNEKRRLLEETGAAVYRYHDSMHFRAGDEVGEAFIADTGLSGSFDGGMGFTCDNAVSAREAALICAEKLRLRHPRIVGDADYKSQRILLALGMRGNKCFADFAEGDGFEIAICGELCEWSDCEPVREAAQMGMHKAIVILGHAGSEKFAMKHLAQKIDMKYGAEARYFDCGEVYTYTD